MILYNYSDFLFEAAEKIPLILSQKLEKKLSVINNPISKAILDTKTNTLLSDISYLDYFEDKDKIDKISFLPSGKMEKEGIENFTAKGRQEMSVGKIVNKLFPDKFTQKDIENFVNDFKAELKKSFVNIKLVEGEEIRYWYLDSRYAGSHGDVNSSCMRHKNAQPFFDIYCNNPDKCKLAVYLTDDNKKLLGRALVWWGMRKPTGRVYMDRIYTINDADKKLFMDYAVSNKWLHKAQQVMGNPAYIDEGKTIYSSVAIQLKPQMYKYYPSLDTLSYYTPSTGRLGSNAGNYIPGNPRYILNSTTGEARKIDK